MRKLFAIITALLTGALSVAALFGSQSISAVSAAGGIEGALFLFFILAIILGYRKPQTAII